MTTSTLKKLILFSTFNFFLLSFPALSQAATINAQSCSRTDVSNAIAIAVDGDTVVIPAGNCAWHSTLAVNISTRSLTIRGAGIDQTVILDNSNGTPLLDLTTGLGKTYRFHNWTFSGGTNNTDNYSGAMVIGGVSNAVRVDHIKWNNLNAQVKALAFYGCVYGVVDHVEIYSNRVIANGVVVSHSSCGGGSQYGDYNWAQPDPTGTANNVFLEDSIIEQQAPGQNQVLAAVNDIDSGGAMVVRYSTIRNLFVQNHGIISRDAYRGGRNMEVYNNTFEFTGSYITGNQAVWIEAGTGVVHNNTIVSGYTSAVRLLYDRSFSDAEGWGICDGSSVYDGNQGPPAGYPCIDQPGRGQGRLYTGSPALPVASSNQVSSPVYIWNNSVSNVSNQSPHIALNRDYIVGTAKPGYTPYIYPHPLQNVVPPTPDTTPPSAPAGLTVQ